MSLNGIVSEDYGQTLVLTITDKDTGNAVDVSGYTTSKKIVLIDPSRNKAEKNAAFVTDGSDGQIEYTLADGDIDEPGRWGIRAKVASANAILTSVTEWFNVE